MPSIVSGRSAIRPGSAPTTSELLDELRAEIRVNPMRSYEVSAFSALAHSKVGQNGWLDKLLTSTIPA